MKAQAGIESRRYETLDSWRGICACLVALFHFHTNSFTHDLPFFRNAYLFVDFFFVLSGFVITATYGERLQQGFGVLRFIALRFGRVYPLHLAVLAVVLSWDLLQLLVPRLAALATYPPFSGPGESLDYIISNLTLTHSLGLFDYLALNGPSWSISTEFYTYLLFAIAISLFGARIRLFWIVVALVSPGLLLLVSPTFMDTTFRFGFIRCIYGFAVGSLLWSAMARFEILATQGLRNRRQATLVEAASLILIVCYVTYAGTGPLSILAPLAFAVAILVFASEAGLVSALLRTKPFLLLGALSYSIYMNQILVGPKGILGISAAIESRLGIALFSTVEGTRRLGANVWQGELFNVGFLLALVAVSWLTFKLIEQPGRALFRRLALGSRRDAQTA